jgi:hypothetical protein
VHEMSLNMLDINEIRFVVDLTSMKYGLLSTCHALLKPFQVHHDGIEKNTNLILDISKMISRDARGSKPLYQPRPRAKNLSRRSIYGD